MNVVPLTVETGRETGTGASRRMRAEGQHPRHRLRPGPAAVSVTIERAELRRALTTAAGVNALIELSYDGEQPLHPGEGDPAPPGASRPDPHRPPAHRPREADVADRADRARRARPRRSPPTAASSTRLSTACRCRSVPTRSPTSSRLDISRPGDRQTSSPSPTWSCPAGVTTELDPGTPVVTAALTRAAIVATRGRGEDGEEGAEDGDRRRRRAPTATADADA